MGRILLIFAISVLFLFLVSVPVSSGNEARDARDVDIDTYITVPIEFRNGDGLDLKAEITASPDPVSIFLIKGVTEFERWRETEEIDIKAIVEGSDNSTGDDSFTVVENFSETNTTYFKRSISIGDKDTYYLVIVIYREKDMSKDEIMGKASRVSYDVEWKETEKEVPYYLIPVAVSLFVLGLALVIYYFRSGRKGEEEREEVNAPVRRSEPPFERKRVPPMR